MELSVPALGEGPATSPATGRADATEPTNAAGPDEGAPIPGDTLSAIAGLVIARVVAANRTGSTVRR